MKHTTRAVSATSFFSPASGDYTIRMMPARRCSWSG